VSQLLSVASRAHLEQAVAEGVLAVDGDRVRPTHPLLGAAARKRSSPARRRELHRELAAVASSEELRVLHLALATELPDPELAGAAAGAAAAAAARGARREAVELSEHALRLTAADAPERPERLLALARRLEEAGDPKRLGALLLPAVDTLPPGEARVRAYVMLAEWAARKGDDPAPLLELGLAESGGDASLRALVLPAMAAVISVGGLQRFEEGEAWASEALVAAGELGREAERHAVAPLAWIRVLRGRPIDDLCERFPATTNTAWPIGESPERPASQRLAWRGDVEGARAAHLRLRALADQRGEAVSFVVQRLHLCELALRVGDCHAATRLLDEWLEVIDDEPIPRRVYERCRELLDVQRGTSERRRIDTQMPAAGRWDRLESLRAGGISALLAHDPPGAVECLRAVWDHTVREGIEEPGVFPAAPDLVEALVETGQTDEARAVIARLQKLAQEQEHPWGLATVDRCRGLVAFADAGADGADLLARAAAGYERLGLRLDRARTLLLLGRAQRRHRHWAAARAALEAAVAAFDELGAPGWAQAARS
jgi:hypothetical protein